MAWVSAEVKDTKGRTVAKVSGGDPKRVEKQADASVKTGYTKTLRRES
ncbi:MAG: hypothetical protein JF597_00640 [Streptomyces sp.]|nr:hypothetical protein [Streptomyces sp.]MBW8792145.1 hypothetical protein [Streptomyces sp.]